MTPLKEGEYSGDSRGGFLSRWPWRGPLYGGPTMRAITQDVAAKHGLNLPMVLGDSRDASIVRARHEAMHACRQTSAWSLPQIGLFFRRDHTTVLYAARKIEAELVLAEREAA